MHLWLWGWWYVEESQTLNDANADKRKRPELGRRTKSTPLDASPKQENERTFSKSLPNGGLDESTYSDYDWASARSNLDDESSTSCSIGLNLNLGMLFGRTKPRSRHSLQESDQNDSPAYSDMDMSHFDQGGGRVILMKVGDSVVVVY